MSEEFDNDDNEFSYSFWVEQHRIMQEKRDELQRKLDIAVEAMEIVKEHIQVFYSASLPEIQIIDEALTKIRKD